MRKEERIFVYGQIFALKKKGFNISQIALETGLSRPTVYKYLDMSLEELESWCNSLSVRRKKLDSYRKKILAWLDESCSIPRKFGPSCLIPVPLLSAPPVVEFYNAKHKPVRQEMEIQLVT